MTDDQPQVPGPEPEPEPTSLARNRDWNLLWSGNALSDLGSAASRLACPLLILEATGSAARAGLVGTCLGLGGLVGGLPAGVLADRWLRRALIVLSSAVQLLAAGSVFAAVAAGRVWIVQFATVAVVQGLAGAVHGAAAGTAMRRIVPARQLREAFARDYARSHGVNMAGPPLGGLLYSLGRAVPFLADTVSCLAVTAAALLLRTRLGPDTAERDRPAAFRADLGEGLRFVLANAYLRYLCLASAWLNALAAGLTFLFVVALREHGASAAVIGSCDSLISAAGLAGALLAGRVVRLVGGYRLVLALFWGAVPATLAVAVLPEVPWAVAGLIGAIVFVVTPANVAMRAYELRIVPDRLQGRVQSTLATTGGALAWVAPAACGALADAFGTTAVFAGIAAGMAAVAVLNHFVRDLRRIDEAGGR